MLKKGLDFKYCLMFRQNMSRIHPVINNSRTFSVTDGYLAYAGGHHNPSN